MSRPIALLLCTLLVSLAFSPLDAAEPAGVVGRVMASPRATLNGLALPGEGTFLSGDLLATSADGWARVFLRGDEQFHLGARSNVRATRQDEQLVVELAQGWISLRTWGEQLLVRSNGVEIAPAGQSASWEVARLGDGLTQVTARQGRLLVRSADRTVQVLSGQSLQVRTAFVDAPQGTGGPGAGLTSEERLALILAILGGTAAAIAIPILLADGGQVESPSGLTP